MTKLDDEPGSKETLYERKRRHFQTSKRGIESTVLQVRGNRIGRYTKFFTDSLAPDLEAEVRRGKKDKQRLTNAFFDLCDGAKDFLKSIGEQDFSEYAAARKHLVFGANEHQRYQILAEMWRCELLPRYGPVSKEVYAANMQISWEILIQHKGSLASAFELIIQLCDAAYLWRSEVTGEHARAFNFKRNKAQLLKASPSRIKNKQSRIDVIVPIMNEFVAKRPHYSGNRIKISVSILDDVNSQLTQKGLQSYTEGSLAKVIGDIIRSAPIKT